MYTSDAWFYIHTLKATKAYEFILVWPKCYLKVTRFDARHILVALSNERATVLRIILVKAMLRAPLGVYTLARKGFGMCFRPCVTATKGTVGLCCRGWTTSW